MPSRTELGWLLRAELVPQHELRSMLAWWWLSLLLIGLLMHFLVVNSPAPM